MSDDATSDDAQAADIPSLDARIAAFLDGDSFAVVGASTDRSKYGNKVLRCYMQNQREVYPINPSADEVEGLKAYRDLAALPTRMHGVSIITPPPVTEKIVEACGKLNIKHLWMQPGAQSDRAIERARELDMNVIGGDACVLVVLGYSERG